MAETLLEIHDLHAGAADREICLKERILPR